MFDLSADANSLTTFTSLVTLGISVGVVTFQYGARRRLEVEFENHRRLHDREFEQYKAEHDKRYVEDRERDLRDFMGYQKVQDELRHSQNDKVDARLRSMEVSAAERAKDCRDFDVRLARIER